MQYKTQGRRDRGNSSSDGEQVLEFHTKLVNIRTREQPDIRIDKEVLEQQADTAIDLLANVHSNRDG